MKSPRKEAIALVRRSGEPVGRRPVGSGRSNFWLGAVVGLVPLVFVSCDYRAPESAAPATQPGRTGPDLQAIQRQITPGSLRRTIEAVAAPESSRVAGFPGCEAARQFILHELKHRIGLTEVFEDVFEVTVPIEEGESRLEIAGPGPAAGASFRLYPLWPNLVRTSSLGRDGLVARLYDVADGSLKSLRGVPLDETACVLLMDFNTEDRWLQSASLGARAIVFAEPASTTFEQCADKFLRTPLDVPRFYLRRADAQRLRQVMAEAGLGVAAGADPAAGPSSAGRPGLPVHLSSHVTWQLRSTANILVHVRGREAPADAWPYRLPSDDPRDPQRESPEAYAARAADLARLYRQAGTDEGPYPFVVIGCYYDAMSVVPTLAPGAESACGLAAWLELAQYLKAHPPARSVFLLATSAHHLGLRGMSEFLHRRGRRLAGVLDDARQAIYTELFIGLDLTSQSADLGIWHCTNNPLLTRYFAPYGRMFDRIAEAMSAGLGLDDRQRYFNGISAKRGRGWTSYMPVTILADGEHANLCAVPAISLVTVNDARLQAESPLDTPDKVRWEDLAKQVRLAVAVLAEMLEEPDLKPRSKMELRDTYRMLRGQAVTFIRRKSPMPDEPIGSAVGVVRFGEQKTVQGVRTDLLALADEKGVFEIRPLYSVGPGIELEAYGLDPHTGRIEYAPDRGLSGDRYFPMMFPLYTYRMERSVVLFQCRSAALFDLIDPLYLTNLTQIAIYDTTNATPSSYGYCLGTPRPLLSQQGNAESVAVVFVEPGRRYKAALGSDVLGYRLLLLNAKETGEKGRGEGYDAEVQPFLYQTSLHAAEDMINLDATRMEDLQRNRISNNRLETLHRLAEQTLAEARQAGRHRQWDRFVKLTQAALGIESRAYPDVRGTQDDVIKGVLFFLALLLPSAFFLERLIFTYGTIGKQIIATLLIFVLVFAMMSWAHPAFKLSNPLIILLAFVIMALSLLVIVLLASRFEAQMQRRRDRRELVHEEDVTRSQVTMTAFLLGVANMKRRQMRTLMTLASVMLMTFAVLSFSSVKTALSTIERQKSSTAAYEGFLIRNRTWGPLEQSTLDYINRHFQRPATVSPRAWYRSRVKNVSFHLSSYHGDLSPLGRYRFQAGPTYTVTLQYDVADEDEHPAPVSADALRLVPVGADGLPRTDLPPLTIDDTDPGFQVLKGLWQVELSPGAPLVGRTFHRLQLPVVSRDADPAERRQADLRDAHLLQANRHVAVQWTFQVPATGRYQLYTSYKADPEAATAVHYTIRHADGQTRLEVDQTTQPGFGAFHAKGMIGLTSHEQEITRVADCLLPGGRWFRDQGDELTCILPRRAAERLKIHPDDVALGRAQVNIFGRPHRVLAILDEDQAQKTLALLDLDDEPITPADFSIYEGQTREMEREEQRQKVVMDESAVTFQTFQHLEPATVVILPFQTLMDLGAEVHSIVVRFPSAGQTRLAVTELLQRLALVVFAGIDGQVFVMSSLGLVSVGGIGGLFVPILLVALIIFNTMIGSVYDRLREIRIYSSVGMAPAHIGFLFMAESLVYAFLGVTGGYLLGQVLVQVLGHFGALGGLSLNYSSLSAVGSAVVVMLVVVLSTLYPAWKASQIAVPDVERKMKVPEPQGDRWMFEFPFTVPARDALGLWQFLADFFRSYSEESVGTFYAANVRLSYVPGPGGQHTYVLDTDMWLAPYDLGVSQHLTFKAWPQPAYGENVYMTFLDIARTSGEFSAWKRVNKRLVTDIRKQFLIWRVVAPAAKAEFVCRGAEALGLEPPAEMAALRPVKEDVTRDE